jgi:cation diffusion facilitator family transporter
MNPHKERAFVSFDDPQRHPMASRSTWVSVGVNVALATVQLLAGVFAHSQALVADGFHSLSDLVCDFLVLVANYHSKVPADEGHPYGHDRVETAASFVLGVILIATGGGIIFAAAMKLQHVGNIPPVTPLALWTAGLSLVTKEGLFRYLLRVGERLRSPMLIANAWHARSDAASSLVVAIGISVRLMGFLYADAFAAIIVGFMIVRMGARFGWVAFQELIDAGLAPEEVARIRETIVNTSGVKSLHELRTRRMAQRALVDAHILVDPRISVSEGHNIAERARLSVLQNNELVGHVLVHVDPEDDADQDEHALLMPSRAEVLVQVSALMDGLPKSERVLLHYLGGKVEAEVYVPCTLFRDTQSLKDAQALITSRLVGNPYLSAVSLNCVPNGEESGAP